MGIQINTIIFAGNLVKDPELKYIPSGSAVCEFTIANNHTYTTANNEKKEEVSFVTVIVWGKIAENCAKYLTKGSGAIVEGRLKQQTWTTDSGDKRSRIKIIASKVTFTSKPKDNPAPMHNQTSDVAEAADLDMGDINFE